MLWSKEVSGVGNAKVLPLWNGNGTVKVMIIDTNGMAADETLISKVADNIEQKRPIGANVTVVSADPLYINITVKLTLKGEITEHEARSKMLTLLNIYLKGIAFKQNYVSYAQIGSRILQVDEILDYQELLVNSQADNIPIAENEIPVLGGLEVLS